MSWTALFPADRPPTPAEIGGFVSTPLWDGLTAYLEERWGASPRVAYSRCTMAPGWNVKYRRGGRSLCTLYPGEGRFTALVVVGENSSLEAEFLLPSLTPYTRALYAAAPSGQGGRWLMVEISSPDILEDVKELIALRARPPQAVSPFPPSP